MSIIEKLGISASPWVLNHVLSDHVEVERTGDSVAYDITSDENAQLIATAPEMLEALIDCTFDMLDRYDLENPSLNPGIRDWIGYNITIIQKATNKSWSEIKELIG